MHDAVSMHTAGNRLASLASLSFTAYATSVKGAALLAAGTDDLVCIYRVTAEKKVSSRKYTATFQAASCVAGWVPARLGRVWD